MVRDSCARITRVEKDYEYSLLSLLSPAVAEKAQPGQFLMVRVTSQTHPLLRRPFSIHDVDRNEVKIFFQKEGTGTVLLSQKKKEETLDILGPLGHGFSLDSKSTGRTSALVGGGRGMAPLFFLARKLADAGAPVQLFYGGKTSRDLPLRTKCEERGFNILCSTEDGSLGFEGLVSSLFAREIEKMRPARVYSCGPEAMMQEIDRICREKGIPAEFSLESIMGCGFGACWGCVRRIRMKNGEEWIKICENGPVFSSESIIWNEGLK